MKTTFRCNRSNPTNINGLKIKKAQNELVNIYLKQQTEYIQNLIYKIRDSVEDRQSKIVWQMINEVSRRKSIVKVKLKATSQEERIHLWKQDFKTLCGKPLKVMQEPITKIISNQLDIELGQFTQEELKSVLRKIKNRRLMKYSQKYRRPGDSMTYCSNTVMPYITKTQEIDGQRDPSSLSLRRIPWNSQELPRYNPYTHSS